MKKLKLLFVACLVPLVLQAGFADDLTDSARAARRSTTAPTTTTSAIARQRSDASVTSLPDATRSATTRQDVNNTRDRTINPRDTAVIGESRNAIMQPSQSVSNRTPAIQSRVGINNQTSGTRANVRSATDQPITATRAASVRNTSGINRDIKSSSRSAVLGAQARSATLNLPYDTVGGTATPKITDYKKCREVYYSCMDEFCANKDTQLKRCACSAKLHDFDKTKQQMSKVEDKILDFNERLLTVSMEKEDAAAISVATDGELGYQKDDRSASKKILDEISKKLKTSTTDTNFERNLSAISLSLDTDSAFDHIDSMMGASTTSKEGVELYNAALPICRQMVAEICDADAAAIAESGYQMAIEQDCNTVSRAYETKQSQALDKVREGSALLDISRLNIHQQRNSDDILVCKKKMLEMLSDNSVCGKDLGKCLDTTGQYIDPSTGQAFLTVNLANLGMLITRPTGNQKWTTAPGNDKFISFLNSKKKYLEPAMENCQDISDNVWDEFIEDALSQIKLAQGKKLEDMRQSCTALTTQCLTNTAKSISEFDARALSIFGVTADKTVNEMCTNVKTACTALLSSSDSDANWVGGMTEIQIDKTYDTILQTCREIGKACIIQTCKSISGNFGLCENIERSVNRKSIVNRSSCWNDVVQCVASAGPDSIDNIMIKHGKSPSTNSGDFYPELYTSRGTPIIPTNSPGTACTPAVKQPDGTFLDQDNCVYDICTDCGKPGRPSCATCRLAERIWGNCEFIESRIFISSDAQNMIKKSDAGTETLLSWFAENTGTSDRRNSCMDTSCPAGFVLVTDSNGVNQCESNSTLATDNSKCIESMRIKITSLPLFDSCCLDTSGNPLGRDYWNNCCSDTNMIINKILPGATSSYYNPSSSSSTDINVCVKAVPTVGAPTNFILNLNTTGDPYYKDGNNFLICAGGAITYEDLGTDPEYPDGQTLRCANNFIVINNLTGVYSSPEFNLDATTKLPVSPATLTQYPLFPKNHYNTVAHADICVLNIKTAKWGSIVANVWSLNPNCTIINNGANPPQGVYPDNILNNLFITY